jgi:hypothetical protein
MLFLADTKMKNSRKAIFKRKVEHLFYLCRKIDSFFFGLIGGT